MADSIRMTEAALRDAMRDERYWKAWNPEREAFNAWVVRGWYALAASRTRTADGKAVVHVRAYERTRKGVVQNVGAHDRGVPEKQADRPPGEDGPKIGGRPGEGDDLSTPTGRGGRRGSSSRVLPDLAPRRSDGRRSGGMDGIDQGPQPITILPSWLGGRRGGGRGGATGAVVPGRFQERIPGLSGKESANNLPSWARGQRPLVNEAPEDFARRMMNEQYPDGWYSGRDDLGADSEFSQLKKYARGFKNP